MIYNEKQVRYMQRALMLASYGKSTVSPNPMVGCVIVVNDEIIGEGWHQFYGGPHAEVNAVNNISKEKMSSLSQADVYVTLEPCAHYGKTPPCAELLVRSSVKNVYVAVKDPNPLVAGKGSAYIAKNGINVYHGLLENEAKALNSRFFKSIVQKQPYVILKFAQTSDNFIARENYDSKWISNLTSRKLVHKWRAEEDAILVGKNTVLFDNPQLSTRLWSGKNPIRLFIDHHLSLKEDLAVFDGSVKTYCFNTIKCEKADKLTYIKLSEENFYLDLLAFLDQEGIRSLFVEGGSSTLQQFIDLNLWDEIRTFTSPTTFHTGIASPRFHGKLIKKEQVVNDELKIYFNSQRL